ncbi:MAG: hypothetical protein AAF533_11040 [Acidobacteriota bacterium]
MSHPPRPLVLAAIPIALALLGAGCREPGPPTAAELALGQRVPDLHGLSVEHPERSLLTLARRGPVVLAFREDDALTELTRTQPETTVHRADPEGPLATALQLRSADEVMVVDVRGALVFRGPSRSEALPRVLAAAASEDAPEPVLLPLSEDEGRRPRWRDEDSDDDRAVAEALARSCRPCHVRGGPAPFVLEDVADLAANRALVAAMLREGHPGPSRIEILGESTHDVGFRPDERELVMSWLDRLDRPPRLPGLTPWPRSDLLAGTIGPPDAWLEVEQPIEVPAMGPVPWRRARMVGSWPDDRGLAAAALVSDHPSSLVEAIGLEWLHAPSPLRPPRTSTGLTGHFLARLPGQGPTLFADGQGKRFVAGRILSWQLRYRPTGRPLIDRPRLALWWDDVAEVGVETNSVATRSFRIPPRAVDHVVRAHHRFTSLGAIVSLQPRLGARARRVELDLVRADGRTESLLVIEGFDPRLQERHPLPQPVDAGPGDRLLLQVWHDNTRDNPHVSDPTRTVTFNMATGDVVVVYFDWLPALDATSARGDAGAQR